MNLYKVKHFALNGETVGQAVVAEESVLKALSFFPKNQFFCGCLACQEAAADISTEVVVIGLANQGVESGIVVSESTLD